MVTVRAVVLGLFSLVGSLTQLKKGVTDFASKLSSFDPIVVVEIAMRSLTAGTDHLFRHTGRGGAIFHGRQRFAMGQFVGCEDLLVVLRGDGFFCLWRFS